MGVFRLLIYGIISGVFIFSLGYDYLYMPRVGHTWWLYKFVMLTMIDLAIQSTYYVICFVCALMDCSKEIENTGPHRKHPTTPSYWRNSKLHRLCDFMYFTSVLPVGVATCAMFWSLYIMDPSLVQPDWAYVVVPPFLQHVTHTAPLPFALVDTLLSCHRAPSRKLGLTVVNALVVAYFFIIFSVRLVDGYWLYPFMDLMSPFAFVIMFLMSCGFLSILYLAGDVLNIMLWGAATHSAPPQQKSK